MAKMILDFRGAYEFLSNFYTQAIPFTFHDAYFDKDFEFYTVEHFFQWYKSLDPDTRLRIVKARTPGQAKRLGRQCTMRKDWPVISIDVMELGEVMKYSVDERLGKKLVDTGEVELIEGNWWHDNLWGDCMCDKCKDIPGQNLLGKVLMRTRKVIKEKLGS